MLHVCVPIFICKHFKQNLSEGQVSRDPMTAYLHVIFVLVFLELFVYLMGLFV